MEILQQVWNGLAVGSIYALIALGYTMVYGVLKFINFAHSEIVMIGAFSAYYTVRGIPALADQGIVTFVASLLIAMVVCVVLVLIIERLAYRPLRNAPRLNSLITAMGVSLLLQNLGQLFFGADPKRFPTMLPSTKWSLVDGLSITRNDLVIFGVAVALMLLLQWIIFGTKVGTAMRAVSRSEEHTSELQSR